MPLDQSVVAYGKRRGYDPIDLDDLNQQRLLFSQTNNAPAAADSSIKYSPVTDITLNLTEPAVYTNELSLFVPFYNSLSTGDRRHLRKYVDGLLSYFASKLSHLGHSSPDSILAPIASTFDFPESADSDSGSGGGQLLIVDQFLSQFRAPFIREYFLELMDEKSRNSTTTMDEQVTRQLEEEIAEEEKEDEDGFNPSWWKPENKSRRPSSPHDATVISDSRLVSILGQIRTASSKLESLEKDQESSIFPYPIKVYNFGGVASGGCDKLAPVCAAVTTDADVACFGCSGDSSIRCFPLRHRLNDDTNQDPFDLRADSKSGIVYRVGLLADGDQQRLLLAASDDPVRPITLFDLRLKEKIYGYRGHRSPVWALDVRANGGGMFVTGSYDRSARFYLLDRKDPVRIFAGHESSVDCVRFIHLDSGADVVAGYPPFVCTASSDRTVRAWSTTDAIPVRMFHGMKGTPKALTTRNASSSSSSPNDGFRRDVLLACATTEAKIFLWHVESGKTYQVIDCILANDLAFSSDGCYLVAAGDNGFFKIYQLTTIGSGEFGSQYVEMTQISQNLLTHNKEAKFLATQFARNELICLTA